MLTYQSKTPRFCISCVSDNPLAAPASGFLPSARST